MKNLNKENCFGELFTLYPETGRTFHTWIDAYKKEVDWNKLFNSDSDWQDRHGKNAPAPKFHEIPFDMQKGILLRFLCELHPVGEGQYVDAEKLRTTLFTAFNAIELKLTSF